MPNVTGTSCVSGSRPAAGMIFGGTQGFGTTLEALVPAGFQRTIQVFGIHTLGSCGEIKDIESDLVRKTGVLGVYELGSTTVDLIKDTQIVISSSYNPNSLKPMFCETPLHSSFGFTLAAALTLGEETTFKLQVQDKNGNLLTNYAGTVAFTSTDGTATLPETYTYKSSDSGSREFKVTFNGSGPQTFTATDAIAGVSTGIEVIVFPPPNATPTISAISDTSTLEDVNKAVSFTISDADNTLQCNASYLSMSSDNTTVIPNANVSWSGTAPNCTATITPVADLYGVANITIAVSDGTTSSASVFALTVTSDGMTPAVLVLGQPDFTSNGSGTTASTLNYPMGISASSPFLMLADRNNHRVLIWDSAPTVMGQAADRVLGQPNFTTATNSNTSTGLYIPSGVASDGSNFLIADSLNHRATRWASFPASSSAATALIGKATFGSSTSNSHGANATFGDRNLHTPVSVAIAGGKGVIGDEGNRRVLIYNNLSGLTQYSGVADLVLGQTDLFTVAAFSCVTGYIDTPRGLATDGTKLVITDDLRNRVHVYNTFPTVNAQTPDLILGQTNATTCDQNQGGAAGASTLNEPVGVAISGSRIYVADSLNSRVLYWNSPSTTGEAAAGVIGQPDFTTTTSGTTAEKLWAPTGLAVMGGYLYVSDSLNNRVMVFAEP